MRRCYRGRWIEPDPRWFWEGGKQKWEAHFFVQMEGLAGYEEKEYCVPGIFASEDAAIEAVYKYAEKLIDRD